MLFRNLVIAAIALAITSATAATVADNDPYLWLSDIHGEKPQAWVKQQNAISEAQLKADPRYAATYDAILKSLDIKDRIPVAHLDHGDVTNFWQDASHVRGLWRRTTIADYASASPNWETLLDLDKLDADEHAQFVWQGADCAPGSDLCLVRLSPGGGDANIVREFDRKTKTFKADGFTLPLSKQTATYLDADTVLVATDYGPGTLTKSSYPRIVKLWHRGEPLTAAKTIFEGTADDTGSRPVVYRGPYGTIALIVRGLTFFTSEYYAVQQDGSTRKLALPPSASLQGVTDGRLIVTLREAWTLPDGKTTYPRGALLAFLGLNLTGEKSVPGVGSVFSVHVLYVPGPRNTIESISAGRDAVYASIYDNVTGSVHAFGIKDNEWTETRLDLPPGGSTTVIDANDWGPQAYFTYESFLKPPTLYATDGTAAPVAIRSQAPVFDASGLVAEQFWATSKDGVKVPYFLIHAKA